MKLCLDRINEVSPYKVEWEEGTKKSLLFYTDSGKEYRVAFVLDEYSAEDLGIYQFEFLTKDKRKTNDGKISQVIQIIIEEFLKSNQKALLYAADSSDGRECCRQRLFSQWFAKAQAETDGMYILKPIGNMAGILVRKNNPQLLEYIKAADEFNQTIEK